MFKPLFLIILIPVVIAAFIVFDKLVRLQYSSYRRNWESDGKPRGIFWVPAEAKPGSGWLSDFGSTFALNRCMFGWLFFTPEWMRRDERALRLVFWLRVLVVTWNLGIVGAVIFRLF